MKLYTEEQVKMAIKDAYLAGIERPIDFVIVDESIMNFLTPITLPSDEEIEIQSIRHVEEYGFEHGAKWMRDKLLVEEDKTLK